MIPSTDLRAVVQEQRVDLRRFLDRTKLIHRDQRDAFQRLLTSKLIAVVLGIRRAGKSTLCFQELDFERTNYVNFDDERLWNMTARDLNTLYELFLELNPQNIAFLFDEIQNVDGWELFVNRLHRKGLKVIVAGSNGQLLGRDLATRLTGRHLSLELFPFSFPEYLRFCGVETVDRDTPDGRATIKRHLSDYVVRGGFPEVAQGEFPHAYLRELFDRIISRDVLQRRQLKSSKALKELALYLIQNTSCLASFQKLSRVFGFKSVHTVKGYVSFLEEAYLIQELLAYSNKAKERVSLPRKYYAVDTGLTRALRAKPTPDRGAELETMVFLHLRRQTPELYHFRTSTSDVDFVVCERGQPRMLIQACYDLTDETTRKRELNALVRASSQLRIKNSLIVTWEEEGVVVVEKLHVRLIPLWKFLTGDDANLSLG